MAFLKVLSRKSNSENVSHKTPPTGPEKERQKPLQYRVERESIVPVEFVLIPAEELFSLEPVAGRLEGSSSVLVRQFPPRSVRLPRRLDGQLTNVAEDPKTFCERCVRVKKL